MAKRRFKVPLLPWTWPEAYIGRDIAQYEVLEYEMSDAYGIEPPKGLPFQDFIVEKVRPPRRQLDPNPLYRFRWEKLYQRGDHVSETIRPVRLSVLPPGYSVVLQRFSTRPQIVYQEDGVNHFVSEWGSDSFAISCRPGDFNKGQHRFRRGVPDCPKCLKTLGKTIWVRYVVAAYVHPRLVEKAEARMKAKARVRSRFPAALERVATDWLED